MIFRIAIWEFTMKIAAKISCELNRIWPKINGDQLGRFLIFILYVLMLKQLPFDSHAFFFGTIGGGQR